MNHAQHVAPLGRRVDCRSCEILLQSLMPMSQVLSVVEGWGRATASL